MEMPNTALKSDMTTMTAISEQPLIIRCVSTHSQGYFADVTPSNVTPASDDNGDEDDNKNNPNVDTTKDTLPTQPSLPTVIEGKPKNVSPQTGISQSIVISPKARSTESANMPMQQIQQIQNIQMAASSLSGTMPSVITETLSDTSVPSPSSNPFPELAVNSQCSKRAPVDVSLDEATSTTVCDQ
ncbi:hypothetical protein BDF19DRAFT_409976 [Syncephalis fuscata]|nr:hypothetical protein BDF19DRAFT_409976 [Syncephalis fuscata]